MIRYAVAALAAFPVLLSPVSSAILPPNSLPLLESQHASVLTALKWFLVLFLLHELNALLSYWAENRWMWKDQSSWNWTTEVAVVTGGAKGIGAMVVRKLVAYGIKVAVLDIEPLSDELQRDESSLIKLYQCDIASRHAVHEAADAIRSDYGSPSILINNAGVGNATTILDISEARLRAAFDVNIISQWNTVQEFLPDMITKRKGHIMSTASLAAFVGLAGMVDYSCTKAALIAFYEGLTQELKHRYNCPQIKTSIVYPGWTRTRLITPFEEGIKSVRGPIMEPETVAEIMVKQIIARRSGQVVLGPNMVASIRALPTWLQELIRDRMANVVTVNATTSKA